MPARLRRICTTGFFRKIVTPTITTEMPPSALMIAMLFSMNDITTVSENSATVANIESAVAAPSPDTEPERWLLLSVR